MNTANIDNMPIMYLATSVYEPAVCYLQDQLCTFANDSWMPEWINALDHAAIVALIDALYEGGMQAFYADHV